MKDKQALKSDDNHCEFLTTAFAQIFTDLKIKGGAEEPFYQAPTPNQPATIHYRANYPRSLLHEMAHYCLAGNNRRQIDDFGYWYSPCGRTAEQQERFEQVEARPQGLERAMCEIVGLEFSPSLDDFSGRPASVQFLQRLQVAYQEMLESPPPSAKRALDGLKKYREQQNATL